VNAEVLGVLPHGWLTVDGVAVEGEPDCLSVPVPTSKPPQPLLKSFRYLPAALTMRSLVMRIAEMGFLHSVRFPRSDQERRKLRASGRDGGSNGE
jgi:hypothetical protein